MCTCDNLNARWFTRWTNFIESTTTQLQIISLCNFISGWYASLLGWWPHWKAILYYACNEGNVSFLFWCPPLDNFSYSNRHITIRGWGAMNFDLCMTIEWYWNSNSKGLRAFSTSSLCVYFKTSRLYIKHTQTCLNQLLNQNYGV